MMTLPNIGQKIAIFYYDEEWGEQLFDLLKKSYENIGVEYQNDREVRFKDGTWIWLYGANPYASCLGRRCDIVLFQSQIDRDVIDTCIRPMATLGRKLALCWHNEKWFRAEELFLPARNAVREAEDWLATLTEDCKYNYDDECELGGWCRYSSQRQKECKCYEVC